MVKNLFKNLEQIIHTELPEKAETFPFPPDDYYTEIAELFAEDSQRILEKINSLKVDHSSRKEAEWMIHAYQEKIDNLMGAAGMVMDKLELTINDAVSPNSWHGILMDIIDHLKEMMISILFRHPDLFNIHQEMSDLMEAIFVKKNSEKLHGKLLLLPEGAARYEAFKLLLLPLEKPTDPFYYTHVFYFQALFTQAFSILEQETEDEEQARQIRELLWKMDFNHPEYISIILEEHAAHLGDSQGKERVKKCLEIRKKIRLNEVVSGAHLHYMSPSLIDQSELWLNTELNCTRVLLEAESIIAVKLFAEFRVTTTFTTQQLAAVLRLLTERRIIHSDYEIELLRFFVKFFVPVSGKQFSIVALRRSFDKCTPDAALQRLTDLLNQM